MLRKALVGVMTSGHRRSKILHVNIGTHPAGGTMLRMGSDSAAVIEEVGAEHSGGASRLKRSPCISPHQTTVGLLGLESGPRDAH